MGGFSLSSLGFNYYLSTRFSAYLSLFLCFFQKTKYFFLPLLSLFSLSLFSLSTALSRRERETGESRRERSISLSRYSLSSRESRRERAEEREPKRESRYFVFLFFPKGKNEKTIRRSKDLPIVFLEREPILRFFWRKSQRGRNAFAFLFQKSESIPAFLLRRRSKGKNEKSSWEVFRPPNRFFAGETFNEERENSLERETKPSSSLLQKVSLSSNSLSCFLPFFSLVSFSFFSLSFLPQKSKSILSFFFLSQRERAEERESKRESQRERAEERAVSLSLFSLPFLSLFYSRGKRIGERDLKRER